MLGAHKYSVCQECTQTETPTGLKIGQRNVPRSEKPPKQNTIKSAEWKQRMATVQCFWH